MDLGAVKAHMMRPSFKHAQVCGHQQDLHEQVLDLRQKGLAKVGERIMVGMQVARRESGRESIRRSPVRACAN